MFTSLIKGNVLKGIMRNKENLSNLSDMIDFSHTISREIIIDTITPKVANEVDSIIRFWNTIDNENTVPFSEREPIKIYIDSLGGSLSATLTILDSIKMSRTPVYTINIGTTYKESLYIYLAGHKRFAYQSSSFEFSSPEQLDQPENPESTFYNYTAFYNKQLEELKLLILDKTKITETQYEKHSKNYWWFTAEDAQKLRICNEIMRSHNFNN